MDQFLLPDPSGKTGLFSLGKATNQGERKLWIQTSCNPLEICFCHILLIEEGLGQYIHNDITEFCH